MAVLGYWNDRALGEPLRLLLHYNGENFIDKRYQVGPPPSYDKTEWQDEKYNLKLEIPNLPYYINEKEGVYLTQFHAIAFYLGEKYSLVCDTHLERAKTLMITEALRDWFNAFADVTYCNAPWLPDNDKVHLENETQCLQSSSKFSSLWKVYLESTLPRHLKTYADILLAHQQAVTLPSKRSLNDSEEVPWLMGKKLTFVDFIFAEYVMQHEIFDKDCLSTFPILSRYVAKFKALPTISAYLDSPQYKAEPLHNRYTHFSTGWVPNVFTGGAWLTGEKNKN